MRKIILIFIIVTSLFSAEFRVGRGSYKTDFSILNFINYDTSYDTSVFEVANPRGELSNSLFYYYNLDYFTSDKKRIGFEFFEDRRLGFTDGEFNRLFCDSESFGGDIDLGIGYDFYKSSHGYVALAINSGVTLPNISSKNLSKKIRFAKKMIDSFDINIYSYKIGPNLRAKYDLNSYLSLFSSFGFGFQKAYIDSDLFKSSVDTKGSYKSFDINLKFIPYNMDLLSFSKELYFDLGYSLKKWSFSSVDVNLYNFFQFDIFKPFDLDLKSSYLYIGVGYNF